MRHKIETEAIYFPFIKEEIENSYLDLDEVVVEYGEFDSAENVAPVTFSTDFDDALMYIEDWLSELEIQYKHKCPHFSQGGIK